MTDEVEDTGPVDTGHFQADIAAQNAAQVAEPEAEVAEVEADEQNEESEESAPSDENDAPAKPRNKGVGKRIDELTREKYDAIRERDHWREMAQRQLQPQPVAQEAPKGRPTLESCGYDQEAYTEALTEFKVQERFAAHQAQQQHAQQQQKVADTLTKFQERLANVDPEDWARAIAAPVPTTPAMLEVIAESEVGPQIGIYLADNLSEATAIARMSPLAQARELGRLEAKLSAPVAPPPAPPKTVTKAPAPVSTLRPAAPIKKPLEEMEMDEYVAERTRQRKAAGLIR